jgi:hypothetical protein
MACLSLTAHAKGAVGITTVPMQLELNRPYIDVTLAGPNGGPVKARAYIDTGGGAIILSAGLAARLGLKATAEPEVGQGGKLAPTTVPALRIGGKKLNLVNARTFISTDEPRVLGRTDAELALPGRFLGRYVVVFDYPAHTFTLADPDSYKPGGTAMKTTFGGGMPAVRISVDGKSHDFLLDTGGQYCMVSDAELGPWRTRHPDWPKVDGVYGPANMQIGPFETKLYMLRIAALQWGPFRIEGAGAVSRPPGPYEKMMSDIVGTPVIGSIGGNVLHHFRVTVDYPAKTVYLDGPPVVPETPLAMVGVMLEPVAHGGYEVAGTVSGIKGIQVGDRLLEVDGQDVTRAPFSTVANLLGGSPGASHTLLLQRGRTRLSVRAAVQPLL